jgi:hypothetical protein
VDGEVPLDITFDEADPPVGGLRTWPPIRHSTPDEPDTIQKLTNIKTGIKRAIKETTSTITKGIFGALLKRQETRAQTLAYKRTRNLRIYAGGTHMR